MVWLLTFLSNVNLNNSITAEGSNDWSSGLTAGEAGTFIDCKVRVQDPVFPFISEIFTPSPFLSIDSSGKFFRPTLFVPVTLIK